MSVLPQLLLNTLQIGAVYVLFALGLTLIFGVMRIINFAHGEFFSLAALLAATVTGQLAGSHGLPLWLSYLIAVLASLATVLVVGFAIYRFGLHRLLRDMVGGFIFSLGLVLLMQGLLFEIFGGQPHNAPSLIDGRVTIFGAAMSTQRLVICIVSLAIAAGLYLFIRRSKLGMGLVAMADDHEAAMLQGVPYKRIALYGFLIGTLLAAIAGCLVAPIGVVVPSIGESYLINGFMIVILGGLGSVPGAIIASFLFAFVHSLIGYFFDLSIASIMIFVAVVAVLILRPEGLTGNVER